MEVRRGNSVVERKFHVELGGFLGRKLVPELYEDEQLVEMIGGDIEIIPGVR